MSKNSIDVELEVCMPEHEFYHALNTARYMGIDETDEREVLKTMAATGLTLLDSFTLVGDPLELIYTSLIFYYHFGSKYRVYDEFPFSTLYNIMQLLPYTTRLKKVQLPLSLDECEKIERVYKMFTGKEDTDFSWTLRYAIRVVATLGRYLPLSLPEETEVYICYEPENEEPLLSFVGLLKKGRIVQPPLFQKLKIWLRGVELG
jgi:hypothetical protein